MFRAHVPRTRFSERFCCDLKLLFCCDLDSESIWWLGEYAYARWTVSALERIYESGEYNDIFPLTFSGRNESVEFDDVIENLRDLMDIAFKSVMGVEQYDEDDDDFLEAKELFINEDGIPYGAVMYGLFLNLWFANVFTIHPSTKHASGAELANVTIHDLTHKTIEYVLCLTKIFLLYAECVC